MSEPQEIYRVVKVDDSPLKTGGYTGRQHVYLKPGTARGVASQFNTNYGGIKFKVQKATVVWEDL